MNNTNCEIDLKPVTDAGYNQDEPEAETFVRDKNDAAGTFDSCVRKRTLSA